MDETEAKKSNNRRQFSRAYEKIIINDDDIVGFLAYGLYQKEKREFVKNNSLPADHERVQKYHEDLQPERIRGLKNKAQEILGRYVENAISAIEYDIEEEARNNVIVEEIKNHSTTNHDSLTNTLATIKADISGQIKTSTSPVKSIFYGAVSSFAFALLLTAAQFIQWTNPFASLADQTSDSLSDNSKKLETEKSKLSDNSFHNNANNPNSETKN